MRPGEDESRRGVIKGCAKPVDRRVTQRAIRREARGDVVWIVRRIVRS